MPIFEMPNGFRVSFEDNKSLADFLRESGLLPQVAAPSASRAPRPSVTPIAGTFHGWTAELARQFFFAVHESVQATIRLLLATGGSIPTMEVAKSLGKDGRVAGGISYSADRIAQVMKVPNPLLVERPAQRGEKSFRLVEDFAKAAKEADLAA